MQAKLPGKTKTLFATKSYREKYSLKTSSKRVSQTTNSVVNEETSLKGGLLHWGQTQFVNAMTW